MGVSISLSNRGRKGETTFGGSDTTTRDGILSLQEATRFGAWWFKREKGILKCRQRYPQTSKGSGGPNYWGGTVTSSGRSPLVAIVEGRGRLLPAVRPG